MTKIREKWIDETKGFAIYLVVLGHSIQYATSQHYDFNGNLVFRLIYGFHMPLFMIVSGYLFWYSLNRYDLLQGFLSKLRGIMIPCAVWGFVTWLCDILFMGNSTISLKGYLVYTFYSNWFLWAVFYCSLYGFITKYLFRNSVWGYGIVLIINYFVPEFGNYAGTKRMLPFFIIGILLHRSGMVAKIKEKKGICALVLLGAMYFICLRLNLAEIITGTIGSAFFIVIFYNLCNEKRFNVFSRLGEVSIRIYLFTGIVFYFWVKEYFRISESYRYLIKSAYVFLMSIILTAIAYILCKLLQKSAVTNLLFLGGQRRGGIEKK